MLGKGGHIRTVPISDWVIAELNQLLSAAGIDRGRIFRKVTKMDAFWGDSITEKAVWHLVKEFANRIGGQNWHLMTFAAHARSCARLRG